MRILAFVNPQSLTQTNSHRARQMLGFVTQENSRRAAPEHRQTNEQSSNNNKMEEEEEERQICFLVGEMPTDNIVVNVTS